MKVEELKRATPSRTLGKGGLMVWARRGSSSRRGEVKALPELLERVIRGMPTGRRRSILRDVGLDGKVEMVKLNFGEN